MCEKSQIKKNRGAGIIERTPYWAHAFFTARFLERTPFRAHAFLSSRLLELTLSRAHALSSARFRNSLSLLRLCIFLRNMRLFYLFFQLLLITCRRHSKARIGCGLECFVLISRIIVALVGSVVVLVCAARKKMFWMQLLKSAIRRSTCFRRLEAWKKLLLSVFFSLATFKKFFLTRPFYALFVQGVSKQTEQMLITSRSSDNMHTTRQKWYVLPIRRTKNMNQVSKGITKPLKSIERLCHPPCKSLVMSHIVLRVSDGSFSV